MKAGFIGLGIMGSRMAANLQRSGYDLVVYNRTKEKAGRLLEGGATWADTPAAVGWPYRLVMRPKRFTPWQNGWALETRIFRLSMN